MDQLNLKWMLGGMITVFVVFGMTILVVVALLTTRTSTNPQIMTATARALASEATVTARALTNDMDNDGLDDDRERELGTNPRNPDSDGDGLSDGQEVNQTGTNPLDRDSDDDGVLDGNESQSAPAPTPLPTINVTRPTTLPVAPVGEVPADSDPAQAVITYYSLVSESRYDLSWSLLTDGFKQIFNCCAPNYNYSGYTEWWDSVDFVAFGDVYTVSQHDDRAIVYADLRYHMVEGGVSQDQQPYIEMVYDPARNAWLFANKGADQNF